MIFFFLLALQYICLISTVFIINTSNGRPISQVSCKWLTAFLINVVHRLTETIKLIYTQRNYKLFYMPFFFLSTWSNYYSLKSCKHPHGTWVNMYMIFKVLVCVKTKIETNEKKWITTTTRWIYLLALSKLIESNDVIDGLEPYWLPWIIKKSVIFIESWHWIEHHDYHYVKGNIVCNLKKKKNTYIDPLNMSISLHLDAMEVSSLNLFPIY